MPQTHDEMVASRFLNHVGHQFCRDWCPTLIFFVLSCVREQRDDGGNSPRACYLASVDHDAQFHQGRVHFPASRVDDIHVVLAHRLCDANVRLANAAPRQLYARDLYAEPGHSQSLSIYRASLLPSADDLRQLWVTRPFERGR